jgi:hypothetical protein
MLAAKLGRAIARSENAEYFKKELFMKIAKWSMTIVVSVLVLLCLYTWKLSQPIFDEKLDEHPLNKPLPSRDFLLAKYCWLLVPIVLALRRSTWLWRQTVHFPIA